MSKEKHTMSKTPQKQKTQKESSEKAEQKTRTPDMRPPHIIFGERLNDELRQMERRYDNIARLTHARKARGESWQVEKAIAWLESHHADALRALRECVKPRQETATGAAAKETFSVVPLEAPPAEQAEAKA